VEPRTHVGNFIRRNVDSPLPAFTALTPVRQLKGQRPIEWRVDFNTESTDLDDRTRRHTDRFSRNEIPEVAADVLAIPAHDVNVQQLYLAVRARWIGKDIYIDVARNRATGARKRKYGCGRDT